MIVLKILAIAALVVVTFFVVTFVVYFFNLDMKLTSALEPLLAKGYDKRERKRKI